MLGQVIVGLVMWMAVAEGQIKSSFSCDGRVSGYYADVGAGCQVYHMCDGLGRRFSFKCPNATLFQQRMLICDHWFMVNCSRSESDYSANLLIGQKEKPFVGETGQQNSFLRTPRPDYIVIKTDQTSGIFHEPPDHSEDSNVISSNSEEQSNVPTSWSTEYSRPIPTADPKLQFSRRQDQKTQDSNRVILKQDTLPGVIEDSGKFQVNFESNYKATTPVYPNVVDDSKKKQEFDLAPPKNKPVVTRIEEINNLQSTEYKEDEESTIPVNFESNFKATTPVYPTFVDESLKLSNLELSPPILQSHDDNVVIDDKTQALQEKPVIINFESKFKATTPVYPKFVDEALKFDNFELSAPSSDNGIKKEEEAKVNFVSNFKATTPVYPLSVEATSPIPDGIGLLPPYNDVIKQRQESTYTTTRPKNFESNFAATVPNYPLSVEATSPLPDEVGLLPPLVQASGRFLNFQPSDEVNYQDQPKDKQPSELFEPPLFDTGYVDPNGALASYKTNIEHVVSPKIDDWNALRRRFSVPDFDFPLDSEIKRASYDSDRSSFMPRPAGSQVK